MREAEAHKKTTDLITEEMSAVIANDRAVLPLNGRADSAQTARPIKRKLHNYLLGGMASMFACLFSNPLEVVKTRMQLQGELQSRKAAQRTYNSVFHAFYTIAKKEGLRGVQSGIVPALGYQLTMNGTRLGCYEPFRDTLATLEALRTHPTLTNIAAGASAGVVGSIVGSPFFLVKTRLQSQSSAAAFGHQHHYRGVMHGFVQIVKTEGPRGLMRGVTGCIPRVAVGSAVQLSTYDHFKIHLIDTGVVAKEGVLLHFLSSLCAGLMVTIAMNPFDVVSTRLYNQAVVNGRGALYDGVLDCMHKVATREGPAAFYKGFTAQYMRLAPHTVLTMITWEFLKKVSANAGI